MSYLTDIADAVWTAETRTLAAGSAGEPTTYLEEIAEAVWTYETRTVAGGATASTWLWSRQHSSQVIGGGAL